MKRARFILLAGVGFACGCQSMPAEFAGPLSASEARRDFVEQRQQRARALESEGALRPALEQWQLVRAVDPGADADAQIARLRQAIEDRFSRQRRAAAAAASRGDYRATRLHLLKALALKPDHRESIAELRSLEARRSYALMARRPEVSDSVQSEVEVYTAARAGTGGSRPAGGQVTAPPPRGDATSRGLAHMSREEYDQALALFLSERNRLGAPDDRLDGLIDESRRALADRHYDLGVKDFRAGRYDSAVSEFAKALEYAPDHHKARYYHSSARQLRDR